MVEPAEKKKNRTPIIAAVTAVLVTAAIAFATIGNGPKATTFTALPCKESTTIECLRSWTANGERVQVELSTGDRLDYEAGKRGDVFLTGNWLCGAMATLAIYRPSTGVVYYLESWPRTTEKPVTFADSTGQIGLGRNSLHIGDHNDDGCADLAIDQNNTRTWYLPAVQAKRLQKINAI
jgi:hypothetical protein